MIGAMCWREATLAGDSAAIAGKGARLRLLRG
jgi:hypothetical protein